MAKPGLCTFDAVPPGSWWGPMLAEWVAAGVPTHRPPGKVAARVGQLWSRYGLQFNVRRGGTALIYPNGWAGTKWLFPRGIWQETIVCGMDCWGRDWERWAGAMRRLRVRSAAFTARQSAQEMSQRNPKLATLWLPEAIDPVGYDGARPLRDRGVDLLEMGRLHEAFHLPVAEALNRAGRAHQFGREGKRLFHDHAEIRAAMGDAKLLVCYPRCDTHPQEAGGVETMTLRYLEGFVSGCVVVGRAPQELVDLFGYNPVIEIDVEQDPGGRVLGVLDRIDEQQELVERNRQRVTEVGLWPERMMGFMRWLEGLGYELPAKARERIADAGPTWVERLGVESCVFGRSGEVAS
ncbi:MAG: hypothetical protein AAF086_03760 [Planctomycetota bacterium]